MPREQFQTLTEQMYYILLSLTEECCGVDVMEKVYFISKGRISVGPGTLYTLLAKFVKSKIIRETLVEGRKKSYIITDYGKKILKTEYERLKNLVEEGKDFLEGDE
ncbi:MAG: PadR family transcriptional regulator [Clostridiaceae bacterium]